jgi:DNA-binding MarR family transcriptional regulator
VADACRRVGLSHAAVNALAVIEGAGAPMLTGEVASRMHITSGSMTSILDTLERKGFVVRTSDDTDRRRVMVDVTPPAQAVLDDVLPAITQTATNIFAGISEERRAVLLDILADIGVAVATLPDTPPPHSPRQRPDHLTR